MSERITQFGNTDMPSGLTQWQTEDMHRKYPNIEIVDPKTALTRIWPTSRVNLYKDRYRSVPRITRPILRRELFEKLCDRMDALMEEKITWR